MLTYFIFMTCSGELDHEPHKDPVITVSMATGPKDLQVIATTGISIILNDKEGDHICLYPDPERARELRNKILDILEEYKGDPGTIDSIFDVPNELDVDVDLKI